MKFNLTKILSFERVLEERYSKQNGKIEVLSDPFFGKRIKVGGITQSGKIIEDIWKKTFKEVKKEKQNVKSILILGFGGGSAAKMAKDFWPNVSIKGIEIDQEMIDLGKKYLSIPKTKLLITDAYKFVLNNKEKYDLVIVDIYKGTKFPKKFESIKFLNKLRGLLNKQGWCVINRLYKKKSEKNLNRFESVLKKSFFKVKKYYPSVNVFFICFR